MKRLIISAAVLITITGMSAWAQAPAADADKAPQPAPAQRVMPMANCPSPGGATADAKKGCPMAPNDIKSEQGATPMHQMMHGMMQGSMHRGDDNQSDQGRGAMNCCDMSNADKSSQ